MHTEAEIRWHDEFDATLAAEGAEPGRAGSEAPAGSGGEATAESGGDRPANSR
jgi:hypothetical protein